MAEGVGFPFPSLPLNEERTYGQPEVVLISLPQVATCSCRRGDSCAEGVPTASLLPNQKKMLSEINAGYGRKGESYHGDISFYSKDCRTQ